MTIFLQKVLFFFFKSSFNIKEKMKWFGWIKKDQNRLPKFFEILTFPNPIVEKTIKIVSLPVKVLIY